MEIGDTILPHMLSHRASLNPSTPGTGCKVGESSADKLNTLYSQSVEKLIKHGDDELLSSQKESCSESGPESPVKLGEKSPQKQ